MSARADTVVVLSPGGGHLARMLPVVASLVARDCAVHVLTRAAGRDAVLAAGGRFTDVFSPRPVEAVDELSLPRPCRLVTFAAAYLEELIEEVAALEPMLVVYDSFFVAAPLIARRLGVPHVGMRAGHAQIPARAIAAARADPRTSISPACHAAAVTLRDQHGLADASPFSWLDGLSPHLNLYPEPDRFLDEADRIALEPLAYFGSLAPELSEAASTRRPLADAGDAPRVYVGFGSVIWRDQSAAALATLDALSEALSALGAQALLSLGRHPLGAVERARLERPGVRVTSFADQWGALKDADLFVTHHGLNSTHEAIHHRVPMLGHPFLGDQPALAARCSALGLGIGLRPASGAPLDARHARAILERALAQRERYAPRLAEAASWEREVVAGRPAVIDRMLSLAAAV